MYDPDTIEFAHELGVDPAELSSSDPYVDNLALFQHQRAASAPANRYPGFSGRYDEFQDNIGDYAF